MKYLLLSLVAAALLCGHASSAFSVLHQFRILPGTVSKGHRGGIRNDCRRTVICSLNAESGKSPLVSNENSNLQNAKMHVTRRLVIPTILLAGQALLRAPAHAFEVKPEAFDSGARLSVPSQWQVWKLSIVSNNTFNHISIVKSIPREQPGKA
jgi:hypothetical protein